MDEDRVTAFGGMSGRVLHEALGPGTFLTGIALGLAFLAAGFVCYVGQAPSAFAVFAEVAVAAALARFALNGQAGEWRGTLFSTRGGGAYAVAVIAARYLLLSLAWLLPLVLLGLRPQETLLGLGGLGMGSGKMLILLMAYVVGSVLTPPLFLVVSLRASVVSDLFRPEHWKQAFRGRAGDLCVLYAIHLGGGVTLAALCLPLLVVIAVLSPRAFVVLGALMLVHLCAFALTLLGRLCGFFAAGEEEMEEAAEPSRGGAAAASRAARPASATAAAATMAMPAVTPLNPSGKPVLLDARERVEAARRLHAGDPAAAIASLEELRASHAPHPLIVHGLCLLRLDAGLVPGAVEAAREAIPLCLERGHTQLAAELYQKLRPHAADLRLERDQVLAVASGLRQLGDWQGATNAYATLLRPGSPEPRAIKGMLQIADHLLREGSSPDGALRIYDYVIQRCGSSPLADYARQGKAEAERRLAPA